MLSGYFRYGVRMCPLCCPDTSVMGVRMLPKYALAIDRRSCDLLEQCLVTKKPASLRTFVFAEVILVGATRLERAASTTPNKRWCFSTLIVVKLINLYCNFMLFSMVILFFQYIQGYL